MIGSGDGAAGALGSADRPVLVEGRGADDGGLIHALGLVYVVCGSVGGHGTLQCSTGGRVVRSEVLYDVVLDERAGGPSVDGEVAVAIGAVGTAV